MLLASFPLPSPPLPAPSGRICFDPESARGVPRPELGGVNSAHSSEGALSPALLHIAAHSTVGSNVSPCSYSQHPSRTVINSPTALRVGAATAASARPPLQGQHPPLDTKLDTEISVAMAALLLTSPEEAEHGLCCWLAAAHEAGCCWPVVVESEDLSRVEQGDRRRSLVQR